MTKYTTRKTNVRLQPHIKSLVLQNTDNFNGFCREALSELLHDLTLRPDKHRTVLSFITHQSKDSDNLQRGTKQLTTLRLRSIDIDHCALNCYDLSRTLRAAIAYKLLKDGNQTTTAQTDN